jgi:hypothetical protein
LFLFAVFRTLPLIDAYQSKKTELPKTMERSAVQPSTGQSLQFAKVGWRLCGSSSRALCRGTTVRSKA